jgi:hypothetical protein
MCTLDLAQKFLDITGFKSHILNNNNQIFEELSMHYRLMSGLHKACGINPEKIDAVRIFMENASSVNEDLELLMAELVARTFTNDEAMAVIDFQESAFGRHFDSSMPIMMEKVADAFGDLLMEVKERVDAEIKNRFDAAIRDIKAGQDIMKEFIKEVRIEPDEAQRLIF